MAYFKINMHPTELPKLGPVKVELPDKSIVEGHFEAIGENNKGYNVVVRYAIPARILIPQPKLDITESEFAQWQADRNHVFKASR